MTHVQNDDLVRAIRDPNLVLYKDKFVCIIADAYPKSKHHYLVLPFEDIHDLHDLGEHHIPKLIYMELKGLEFVMRATGVPHKSLHAGYHAFPSMDRLHLHVLSTDFCGEYMTKPYQWNSFHTEFFVPTHKFPDDCFSNEIVYYKYAPTTSVDIERLLSTYKMILSNRRIFAFEYLIILYNTEEIITELQTNGCISLPPNKLCLQQPLLCHVCGYKSLAVQNIKLHIALKHTT